ncbi:MAG: ATP-binding protein [Candidatus Aminicenantes bacterium]|nr:ATP-binding protein [Candidatus Aminicenantes bacterium]
MTSNRSFSQWNEIIGDTLIATAILEAMALLTLIFGGNSSSLGS